jgi:cholesterol transport system auxiliary component
MMAGRGVDFGGSASQDEWFAWANFRESGLILLAGIRVKPVQLMSRLAVLSVLLAGCAVLGKGPAPLDTYELTAPHIEPSGGRSHAQILIAEPSALKAVDGQNIVIKPGPGVIQYLKGAQWADRLPRIVQARLAETFQRSGKFTGVGRPGEGLAIDYQIIAEIRAFEVRVDGSPRARVELFVRLLNDRNGVVRATKIFEAAAAVSGAGNDAYVSALDSAFGTAAAEIVKWVDSQI